MNGRLAMALAVGFGCALCLVATLAGCGGADFGMRVDVPAKDRVPIGATVGDGVKLTLPGDQAFNIHSRQSAQTPGAAGSAQGASQVAASGTASCVATGSDGGAGWGEFQIGHAMTNTSGQKVRMAVALKVDYAHQATADPFDAPNALASGALKVYVKDSRGYVLHQAFLVQINSDDGPMLRSGTQHVGFEAVLDPDRSYDLVVAGRASVTSEPGAKTSAQIEIKQLTAELTFESVAPPQAESGDGA